MEYACSTHLVYTQLEQASPLESSEERFLRSEGGDKVLLTRDLSEPADGPPEVMGMWVEGGGGGLPST